MTAPEIPKVSWSQVTLAAIVVPSIALLVYGLVKSGESLAAIVAGVTVLLAAVGYQASQASRASTQIQSAREEIAEVKTLANGNLSRADAERAKVQGEAIERLAALHEKQTTDMRAQYQQMLALAVQLPPGTAMPQLTLGPE